VGPTHRPVGDLQLGRMSIPSAIGRTGSPRWTPRLRRPEPSRCPEESGIARVKVLALAREAERGRVIWVEPSARVGGLLVDILGPSSELLHVLILPDFERVDAIGSDWELQDPHLREQLIDCDEDTSGGARRDAAGGRTLGVRASLLSC
jgi:hypothetical protein